MEALPDFLRLSDEDAKREQERQDRLRREFNSRARLSPVEQEAGRAQAVIPTLLANLRTTKGADERNRLKNQLAEAYAAQGQFLKAAETAKDKDVRKFYRKAADAIFNGTECQCSPPLHTVEGRNIRLPRYRVVKEVYSMPAGAFGWLSECNACGNMVFLSSDPTPKGTGSDMEILK